MKTLRNKVVVITGAGSGIGRAVALEAAGRGARLALSDVDESGLALTEREIAARYPTTTVRTARLDVADRPAFAAYASAVASDFGVVNVVVNNAGVAMTGTIAESDYADIEWVLGIDFWGVVHGTKEFLPHLIASGDGHIVNISSLFGLMAVPTQAAYNAAKFAVRGFTESLRMEMLVAGSPVGVTAVHPGGVKTAIARNARAAAAHDQTALADFFDSKLARTTPESAARAIVDGIIGNKPRVVIGADAKFLDAFVRLFGGRYSAVVAKVSARTMPAPSKSPV
ncbi:SDR family NAD(P)-dependent oxidoreductase [Jatrophihabitans telluris]|uniref:SDR family NAD(P)-dependent oxidoreductase n=1 Tax=Jatrophihabitans telluris TaxID=2038343 RepID=A0ABY4R0C1_9ACTN|nr:SDR family NAD(P)-dependent oxidoreductase [Jatrophihabitans telluris]UQX88509.1 SDR family NAD(P)-dependent oxidoreductase [Jatrophihabitans telluris]